MLETNNLSASELLTAFIDGELDSSDTQMLFYQLANDPELQSEMQDLITMRNTFSNAYRQTPPPDLQSKILKSTVYKNGIAGRLAFLAAILSNNYIRIPASVAALILIGLFSFWLVDNEKDSEAEFMNATTAEFSGLSISDNQSENISEVNSEINQIDNDSENQAKVNSINNSDKNSTAASPEPGSSANYSSADELYTETSYNSNTADGFKGIDMASAFLQNAIPPQRNVNRKDYINFYSLKTGVNKFLEKVSFSLSKQSLLSSPNPKISTYEDPALNDFSFNLNYHINKNHILSAEIGREYFPMVFSGTELSGIREIEYEYPLAYNAIWGGIGYTYNFTSDNYSGNFTPYTGITIGGTSLGPVTKLSLGANYFINDNIGFFAGLKYGALFYSHQNNMFVTSKYGLDYGLIIKL